MEQAVADYLELADKAAANEAAAAAANPFLSRQTRVYRPSPPDVMDDLVKRFPTAGPPENADPTGTIYLDSEIHGYGDAAVMSWVSEGTKGLVNPSAPWKLIHRAREHHLKATLATIEQKDMFDINAIVQPVGSSTRDFEFKFTFVFRNPTGMGILLMQGEIRDNCRMTGMAIFDHQGSMKKFDFRSNRYPVIGTAKDEGRFENPLGDWNIKCDLPGYVRESKLTIGQENGKASFLRMLGQEVDTLVDTALCVTTFHAYDKDELEKERGSIPRVLSRARSIGIYSTPRRPSPIAISQAAHDWADGVLASYQKDGISIRKLALLFPQTCWRSREYPPSYWNDLAWMLQRDHKVGAITLLDQPDDRHTNLPRYMHGMGWEYIAALMLRADLVIGNDSGPANVSGTLGVPTLALMGPTNPLIFAHMPEVRCLAVKREEKDCVGCHFGKPYRSACDQGCMALMKLQPERVVEVALEMMGG